MHMQRSTSPCRRLIPASVNVFCPHGNVWVNMTRPILQETSGCRSKAVCCINHGAPEHDSVCLEHFTLSIQMHAGPTRLISALTFLSYQWENRNPSTLVRAGLVLSLRVERLSFRMRCPGYCRCWSPVRSCSCGKGLVFEIPGSRFKPSLAEGLFPKMVGSSEWLSKDVWARGPPTSLRAPINSLCMVPQGSRAVAWWLEAGYSKGSVQHS